MNRTMPVLAIAALMTAPVLAQEATARFIDTEATEIGSVTLTQTEEGVQITGTLEGLPADRELAFHVHEIGTCDALDDFESAGEHFSPEGNEHGHENPEGPHAGDMLNQTVDSEGRMEIDAVNPMISLIEGTDGYLYDADGSALMIHAEPDDYVTDPSGNAGARIACAVIEAPVP